MGMRFAPTWLRQVSPLLHKTTLTTGKKRSEETQTLRAVAEPKKFAPPQTPSQGRGTAKI